MWQKYIFLSVPFSSTMLCLTVVATCCFSTQGESWRSQAIHWQEISTSHPNLTSCWWISQTEEFASACESFSYRMTRRCYHSPPPLPSVCLQVTQKAGRTSLSPETPTTWWEPTAFLCSSTTSKDGRSGGCDVTECETVWDEMKKMDTHTFTQMHSKHTHTHTTWWSMKKTQSVLFTAPMDEGETLMIVTSCSLNFSPRVEVLMWNQ